MFHIGWGVVKRKSGSGGRRGSIWLWKRSLGDRGYVGGILSGREIGKSGGKGGERLGGPSSFSDLVKCMTDL